MNVIRYFGLNEGHLLNLLGISKNTLRRAIRARRRLTPAQSDRLYRLVRVGRLAEEVLVNREGAHAWLVRPRRALAGVAPIDLLDTDVGAQAVETLLARIEHGIVS